MPRQDKFSDLLWNSISSVYDAILKHPFLSGLTSGKLRVDRFREYVIQDSLYLQDFSKTLKLLSLNAPKKSWEHKFARDSQIAIEVERNLHEAFFRQWKLRVEDIMQKRKNPTNTAYTSYILASAATRPFPEGVASVLPCYWIYLKVGQHLESTGSPNSLYQKWIEMYSSEEYEKGVNEALDIIDSIRLTSSDRDNCRERFKTAAIYELLFWDAAYRFEKWKY